MSRVRDRIVLGLTFLFVAVGLLALNAVFPASLLPWSVAATLTMVGTWELVRMGSLRELRLGTPLWAAAVATSAFAALGTWNGHAGEVSMAFLGYGVALASALPFVVKAPALRRRRALVLAAWSSAPLFGLIAIEARWGLAGLAALLVLSKLGDVCAYFVGRAIGKTHPFPRLSSGKTTAGFVASFFAALVAGALLTVLGVLPEGRLGLLGGTLAGATLNVGAQAGDLFESWVKRSSGVKDSSALLGASGGVLDLLDSLLFSIPMALLTWPVLFPSEGLGA